MQDLTFALSELHKVLVSLILQSGSPFQSVHWLTQFDIADKLHPGTLDPIIQTTDEDTKSVGPSVIPWGTPVVTVARVKGSNLPPPSRCGQSANSPPTTWITRPHHHILISLGGGYGK